MKINIPQPPPPPKSVDINYAVFHIAAGFMGAFPTKDIADTFVKDRSSFARCPINEYTIIKID